MADIPIVSVMNSLLLVKRKLVSIFTKTFKRFMIASKVQEKKLFCFCPTRLIHFHTHTHSLAHLCLEHTYPLEKEIAELAESIFAVKAQQEYIVVRERQHRDSKDCNLLYKLHTNLYYFE